jgi:hypothetical protein
MLDQCDQANDDKEDEEYKVLPKPTLHNTFHNT